MFWGPRLSLEEATANIRTFLAGLALGVDMKPDPTDPDRGDPLWLGFDEDTLKGGAKPMGPDPMTQSRRRR